MKQKAKILKFKNEEEWKDARAGKITGTKVKGIVAKRGGYNLGFYELLGETIGVPRDPYENVMDRGLKLEKEAINRFERATSKKVDDSLAIVVREDDERIAYSPDGLIGKTEDVEVKCLSQSRHLQTYITKKYPSEYEEQLMMGFVVNPGLKTRYMVFLDPTLPCDFFYLTIKRKDHEERIEYLSDALESALAEIDKLESELTFGV